MYLTLVQAAKAALHGVEGSHTLSSTLLVWENREIILQKM